MSDGLPNELPESEQASVSSEKDSAFDSAASLGVRLTQARVAKEWTVEYVASQLNLAARQIQALESENYAALPGMASVRGFVRAYAKLLKIDADPLVALIASEQIAPNLPLEPKPNLSSAPFSDARLNGGGQRKNSAKGILIAVVVVLLAAAVIGLEHMGGWPALSQSLSAQFKDMSSSAPAGADGKDQTGDTQSGDKSQDTSGTAGKTADTSEPVFMPTPTPATSTTPAADAPGKDAAMAPAQAAPAPAPTPTPVVQAPVTPTPAAPAMAMSKPPVVTPAPTPAKVESKAEVKADKPATAGQGTLVLTGRQNSWIDLRAGNTVLMSRLLKAGETERIEVPGAATLTVGNAAGVDVVFRGQAVENKGDAKSNVARISLK